MNGASALWRTLADAGLRVCFSNPGTTELTLVRALADVPEVRPVLCLFEGVATGAADGYGRMAGQPAVTLSHLGPGFSNGLANAHNARRARTPMVNLVGDHATWHRPFDPPLASDIESLARTVSGFVRTSASAAALPGDAAAAVEAARLGQIATLVVPADCQWSGPAEPVAVQAPRERTFDAARLDALTIDAHTALLLGGEALRERGLRAAARIAAGTGCALYCETFPARLDGGGAAPVVRRFPYVPEMVAGVLRGVRRVVLFGAGEPIAYFGYENGTSRLLPKEITLDQACGASEDVAGALDALAARLGADPRPAVSASLPETGPLGVLTVVAALARIAPEGSIVVDEGVSAGGAFLSVSGRARPFSYLSLTGGATGMGLPCAIGAALACPGRRVFVIEGDGSAMYTPQALWTQASLGLDITTLVLANHAYRMLKLELQRGVPMSAAPLTEFGTPRIDWPALSRSQGVPGERVDSVEGLSRSLERSIAGSGPTLIEVPT